MKSSYQKKVFLKGSCENCCEMSSVVMRNIEKKLDFFFVVVVVGIVEDIELIS